MAGQLNLFKGKRQRGTQAPPPLEFASHCFVADLLKRWCNPAWQWTHIPSGELRDKITASKLQRMGTKPGWPDFIFIGPNRFFFGLELKRIRTGRISEEQSRVGAHIEACGFAYLCTSSVDVAVAELKRFDILPSTISVQ
jgi:hypothetical protein